MEYFGAPELSSHVGFQLEMLNGAFPTQQRGFRRVQALMLMNIIVKRKVIDHVHLNPVHRAGASLFHLTTELFEASYYQKVRKAMEASQPQVCGPFVGVSGTPTVRGQ